MNVEFLANLIENLFTIVKPIGTAPFCFVFFPKLSFTSIISTLCKFLFK